MGSREKKQAADDEGDGGGQPMAEPKRRDGETRPQGAEVGQRQVGAYNNVGDKEAA